MRNIYRTIGLFVVLSAQVIAFGQSPYDHFDDKQKTKHTYRLPEMVFKMENEDTTDIIRYAELDIETLLLKFFSTDDSLLVEIELVEGNVKFISRDPKFAKYFWQSPYMAFANNPVRYVDPAGMSYTNFEDADGKLISHVADGSNAVFRLTARTNQTNSSFQLVGFSDQGGANTINMAGVIAGSQDYVMNNYSHCNQAVNFVGRTYNSILDRMGTDAEGGSIVNGNSVANDIINGLSNSSATSYNNNVTERGTAQVAAEAGNLVVGAKTGNPHGHVNMVTTGDFTITRYARDGTSTDFNYNRGHVANVNGSTTTGLGPNRNNSYYPMKGSHVTNFYSIDRKPVIHLPTIIVRP